MRGRSLTFPLLPRRRVAGVGFGSMRSQRFGHGFDLAGSRPYAPGDDVRRIDWRASARVSSVRGNDDFVVREYLAERTTHVVILVDRSPRMAVCPDGLPWLSKPAVIHEALAMLVESAIDAGCSVGYLDDADASRSGSGEDGESPFWRPPTGQTGVRRLVERLPGRGFGAPEDTVERLLRWLAHPTRRVSSGTFVFVLSDYLSPPTEDAWIEALARGLDPVPVVIQDPVWEQSFPDVAGAVLPLVDPASGRLRQTRLRQREVGERRRDNERRLAAQLDSFERVGLSPVVLSSSDPGSILAGFLGWAETRRLGARLVP